MSRKYRLYEDFVLGRSLAELVDCYGFCRYDRVLRRRRGPSCRIYPIMRAFAFMSRL